MDSGVYVAVELVGLHVTRCWEAALILILSHARTWGRTPENEDEDTKFVSACGHVMVSL